MTSLSLVECCRLLAIDPKTLRQWVAQAQMGLHTDPTNAKIKCLTSEQVQSLARLHGRVLKPGCQRFCSQSKDVRGPKPGAFHCSSRRRSTSQARADGGPGGHAANAAHRPGAPTAQASGSSAPSSVCSLWKPGTPQGENRPCFVNRICGISARPASHASAGVPFPQATNASDPAH